MNEGQYNAIRNYLEEIASNQKQILAELRRTQAAPVAPVAEKPHEAIARIAATKPIPATSATADKPASRSAAKTTAAKKGK